MSRRVAALGIALFVASCAPKEGGQTPVATVNGQAISAHEFHTYLEHKPNVAVLQPDGKGIQIARVNGSLGYQGLEDLIGRRILLDLAKEKGVLPSKEDIDAEIAFQQKSDSSFVQRLTDQGMTLKEIEADVLVDLAQERLITQGVSVSDAEVTKYIESNPHEFEVPAQASLLWIVLDRAELKAKVDAELTGGQNFRLVARKYSVAPGVAENGGEFPERRLDRLPLAVRKRIEATEELQTTPWFLDGQRWVKLYVEKKVAARKLPIDTEMRQKVRRAMAIKRGQENRDLRAMLAEATRKAKVEITRSEYDELWAKSRAK